MITIQLTSTTKRRWLIYAAGVFAFVLLLESMCHSLSRQPLADNVASHLERATVAGAVDTAEIHRLAVVAALAARARDSARVAAQRHHPALCR